MKKAKKDWYGIFTKICIFIILILIVLSMVKCSKLENFVKFPQPDKRKMFGSVDCAYALNGGNTAYCNDWLNSYRKGLICSNDGYEICCERALKCCNEISTCDGGHDCRYGDYKPTKDNTVIYDSSFSIDQ